MFQYLMASVGDGPDEAKVRLYCEGSVAHYDWLVAQGVPFKPVFYYGCSGEPPTDDGLVWSGSERALAVLRRGDARAARSRAADGAPGRTRS